MKLDINSAIPQTITAEFVEANCDYVSSLRDKKEKFLYFFKKGIKYLRCTPKEKTIWKNIRKYTKLPNEVLKTEQK